MKQLTHEVKTLLSELTGQEITPSEIEASSLFLLAVELSIQKLLAFDEDTSRYEALLAIVDQSSLPTAKVHALTQIIRNHKTEKPYPLKELEDTLSSLTSLLEESERLLLISFLYEIFVATTTPENLEAIEFNSLSNFLLIKPRYQNAIESIFLSKGELNLSTLNDLRSLLDPTQFAPESSLSDLARRVLENFSTVRTHSQNSSLQDKELQKFRENRAVLTRLSQQFHSQVENLCSQGFISRERLQDVTATIRKLDSSIFRVAVVGEFNCGKSTLLNALLAEEIQPTSAIPCSATLTVFRYGQEQRVTCYYKNGQQEEIQLSTYHQKSTLPPDIESLSDTLSDFEIEEIVIEHPDLEICRNGIEIIDSPGLNEHPQRTRIVERMLDSADAAILIISVRQPFTQAEKELLNDLRLQLNNNQPEQPTNRLFVVANMLDTLRREKDRKGVRQRIEQIIQGKVLGSGRIHLISAQEALEASQNNNPDNRYSQGFQVFVNSLERFLIEERGTLKVNKSVVLFQRLINSCLSDIQGTLQECERSIQIEKQKRDGLLQSIGVTRQCANAVQEQATGLKDKIYRDIEKAWTEWFRELKPALEQDSDEWKSEHSVSPIWSRNSLKRDYVNSGRKFLKSKLDNWVDGQVNHGIIERESHKLESIIENNLIAIEKELRKTAVYRVELGDDPTTDLSSTNVKDDFFTIRGLIGGVLTGSTLSLGLAYVGGHFITISGTLLTTLLGVWTLPALVTVGSIVTIASSVGLERLDIDGIKNQIKEEVINTGISNLRKSKPDILSNIKSNISNNFNGRVGEFQRVSNAAIDYYQSLLNEQERRLENIQQEYRQKEERATQEKRILENLDQAVQDIFLKQNNQK